MKTPYCGISVSESGRKCRYCNAGLKNGQDTDASMLQDFLAFPDEISDIVGEYGNLLDEMIREKSGKLLRPLSELPNPKEDIEKAHKTALEIAKDETLKNQLERALIYLEDFIPDDEVPEDPDENLKSWLSGTNWKNPKLEEILAITLIKHFIKEYGDNAKQKVQEFLSDLRKSLKSCSQKDL